jgi:hypothetical protein
MYNPLSYFDLSIEIMFFAQFLRGKLYQKYGQINEIPFSCFSKMMFPIFEIRKLKNS